MVRVTQSNCAGVVGQRFGGFYWLCSSNKCAEQIARDNWWRCRVRQHLLFVNNFYFDFVCLFNWRETIWWKFCVGIAASHDQRFRYVVPSVVRQPGFLLFFICYLVTYRSILFVWRVDKFCLIFLDLFRIIFEEILIIGSRRGHCLAWVLSHPLVFSITFGRRCVDSKRILVLITLMKISF